MAIHGEVRTPQSLGEAVATVRTRHGLSQATLAADLKISPRYLSELETGKPKVLNARLIRVLSELGITVNFTIADD